jgi:hypothetical protein
MIWDVNPGSHPDPRSKVKKELDITMWKKNFAYVWYMWIGGGGGGGLWPRIREYTGSVIGAAQERVYIVVSHVWGHCIIMLRASLGKVVHTVKRAGTYAAKVPPK